MQVQPPQVLISNPSLTNMRSSFEEKLYDYNSGVPINIEGPLNMFKPLDRMYIDALATKQDQSNSISKLSINNSYNDAVQLH